MHVLRLLRKFYNFYNPEVGREELKEQLLKELNETSLPEFLKVFERVIEARCNLKEKRDSIVNLLREKYFPTSKLEGLQIDTDTEKYCKALEQLKTKGVEGITPEFLNMFLQALDECRAYDERIFSALSVVDSFYNGAFNDRDWDWVDFYSDLRDKLIEHYALRELIPNPNARA
ncbi:hypothetical protein [Thermocrinis sp.]|jgi:site-specific recombinase XerD|uniref:hypothetical protein n=1 Tax=Thermocrinis sp. TaxID=2024383 RepID=UPI003C0308E5